MKRNKRLLLKAAKRIEEIPRSYRQSEYYKESGSAPCGTVCCLAGEIIIASERSMRKGVEKLAKLDNAYATGYWVDGHPIRRAATKLSGLTESESLAVFGTSNAGSWPKPFRSMFRKGRARAAVALLRYLADGGRV